jgi:predicted transcriptional regulator
MHNDIMNSMTASTPPERSRLSIDLSPVVSSLLDNISEVTGQTKASIISGALLDALPALLARADGLKKRHHELNQGKRK